MGITPSGTIKGVAGNGDALYISKVVFKEASEQFPQEGNPKYLYIATDEHLLYCWNNKYIPLSSNSAGNSINDETVSPYTTWSSKKLDSEIKDINESLKLSCETKTVGATTSYSFKQGNDTVVTFDINNDKFLLSGEVVENPTGQATGTYIKLNLKNDTTPIYVNVDKLIDVYSGSTDAKQVQISVDNKAKEISASIVPKSITSTELADSAVTNGKIADSAISLPKLANDVKNNFDTKGSANTALGNAKTYTNSIRDEIQSEITSVKSDINSLESQSTSLQSQINNIVLTPSESGDVAPEVLQARVGHDGTVYDTLYSRLDSDYRYKYGSLNIEWTDGYLVNGANGVEVATSGMSVSGYIDISEYAGSTIEICCRFASTSGYAFYDSDKKYISGANKNTLGVSVGDYTDTIVIPTIAKYVRATGMTNNISKYYIKLIPSVAELLTTSKKSSIFTHKIAMFGDSITLGRDGDGAYSDIVEYTIPRIVGAILGVECTNYGVGGMGWLPNESLETTAYDKISSVDLTQYDIITLCYGTNDHRNTIGEWDSTDETTCMGQFNKCINYIYEQNPTARVVVIAPWNGKNVGKFPDYWYGWNNGAWGSLATELQRACEHYWIPFISQQTNPINGYTIQSLIGADGTHPNPEGYKRIGEWLAHEMLNLTSSGISYKYFDKEIDTLTSNIKSVLKEYNAFNLIPEPTVAENTKSGITMSATNGKYTISGTSSNVWFYDIAGSTTTYPTDFVAGETYRITFEPTDTNIYLRIWQYDEDNPSGVSVLFTNTSSTFTVPTNATGLLVRLHIVKGRTVNGVVKPIISKNLTNTQLEELIVKETPSAMLTIIDDDGHIGFMSDLLPIIESKHVPIATAITETRIGSESKWMTWEQILDCYGRGAEVLCHTYDHDPNTPDKDIKQIEWEYTVARNNMFRHGLHDADILVYNNVTGSSEKCQEAASKVFKCAIHSAGRVINQVGSINPYYIQRIPVELDPYYYDVEQLKALIDENIEQGGWMIWIIHTSAESWNTYNGAQAMTKAIDYAIEKGLPIVSADYGYRKYIARE